MTPLNKTLSSDLSQVLVHMYVQYETVLVSHNTSNLIATSQWLKTRPNVLLLSMLLNCMFKNYC